MAASKKARKPEEFRGAHDKSIIVPAKIRAGIKNLGVNGWLYESEFLAAIDVAHTDFGRFKAEFEEFTVTPRGKNPRRVWCGSKKLAAKFREYVA